MAKLYLLVKGIIRNNYITSVEMKKN